MTSPPAGVLGAEVVGWNSAGVLLEQLSGFVPNLAVPITPDGFYFIVGTQDLSTFDGSIPVTQSFTFTQTGQIPSTAVPGGGVSTPVPEPASAMLLPAVLVGLMLARLPSVRSVLRAR